MLFFYIHLLQLFTKTKNEMKQFNEVQRLVYSMLIENTGKHFLDSGGTNGRHHQRNANKTILDFYNEDEQRYEYDPKNKHAELIRTVSVFHYLSNDLELDAVCDIFNDLNTNASDWDCEENVYGVSIKSWDYLDDNFEVEILRTWNTYNGDCDLSQTLQGSNITINGQHYILIQIHGGADVRGGYTDAKLFKNFDDYLIHQYLYEYIDSYQLKDELEYIDKIYNYWKPEQIYKGAVLNSIKNKLINEL